MNVKNLKIVIAKVIRWNKQGSKENSPKWAVAGIAETCQDSCE